MKDNHASMINQSLIKTRLLRNSQVYKKRRVFYIPEKKRGGDAIKYIISNRLKVSPRWINHKMRRDIINY